MPLWERPEIQEVLSALMIEGRSQAAEFGSEARPTKPPRPLCLLRAKTTPDNVETRPLGIGQRTH